MPALVRMRQSLLGLLALALLIPAPATARPARAPRATFTVSPSATVRTGDQVTLDASASTCLRNGQWSAANCTSYSWDESGAPLGTGKTLTVTFNSAGTKNVRLTVTDASKRTAQTTRTITVTAPSPTPTPTSTPTPTPTPSPGRGLSVRGADLYDGDQRVFLRGINYSGAEYACAQGWGIFDGPSDDAVVSTMKSWGIKVVHLGLNETCALGINGVQAQYGGANYMNAIKAFVNRLHAQGIYAEVSLMWAAPGTQVASGHPAILNADHSADALKLIANTFKDDPNTMIGLQSEPHNISWQCWRDGGSACSVGYTALGMQGALNAVRSTGATNVVTASGIDYANNLSQWLTYRPADPAGRLIAEQHVYGGNSCASATCLDSQTGLVAQQVPVVFGETGEHYANSCAAVNTPVFLNWNEAHADGWMAWVWNTWGDCSSLISSFNGTTYNSDYARYVRSRLSG